ncbi:MAG: hypothetical protein U0350_15670 [Caldilineaceae bacterium]
MAVYEWAQLLQKWETSAIEGEQMIGQLAQWGQQTHERIVRCEHNQRLLEQQVQLLAAQVAELRAKRAVSKA